MKTRNIRRVLAMMLIASLLVGIFALTAGASTCDHTYVASRISNGNGTHTTINQCSKCGAIGATGTYVCTPGYASYSQGSNYGHYVNTTCTVCYGIATSTFEACTLIAQPYTYTATHHTTSSYCPYCGNTYSGTYAHTLSTSTTYNTTHHQTTTGCYVCGYSNSMSYPHNLSTSTNSISSTQHQTVTACSGCGYNTTITGYHNLNTSTSSISATQHQTVTSCSGCDYRTTNTGNHIWINSYTELNNYQHRKTTACNTCGYINMQVDEDHNGSPCTWCGCNALTPVVSATRTSPSSLMVETIIPQATGGYVAEYILERCVGNGDFSVYDSGYVTNLSDTKTYYSLPSNQIFGFRSRIASEYGAYGNISYAVTDVGYYWPSSATPKTVGIVLNHFIETNDVDAFEEDALTATTSWNDAYDSGNDMIFTYIGDVEDGKADITIEYASMITSGFEGHLYGATLHNGVNIDDYVRPTSSFVAVSAQIYLNTAMPDNTPSSIIMHELGHALGLAHCHEHSESEESATSCRSSTTCLQNIMNPFNENTVCSNYDVSSLNNVYLMRPMTSTNYQMNIETQEQSTRDSGIALGFIGDVSTEEMQHAQYQQSILCWAPLSFDELLAYPTIIRGIVREKSMPTLMNIGYDTVCSMVAVSVVDCIKGDVATGEVVLYSEEGGETPTLICESPNFPKVEAGQEVVLFINEGRVVVCPDSLVREENGVVTCAKHAMPQEVQAMMNDASVMSTKVSLPAGVELTLTHNEAVMSMESYVALLRSYLNDVGSNDHVAE